MFLLLNSIVLIVLMLISIVLLSHKNAYAYIDPGAGSMIVQVVIGVIAGSAMAIKIFWKKIKRFFLRFRKTKTTE